MGRFKSLVDSKEGIESFRVHYKIPLGVGIRYCSGGQWHEDRQVGEVVIPMIAFIEGGMKIPMGGLETTLELISWLPLSVPPICLGS